MKSSLYNSICEPPTNESGACGSDLNIKLSADSLPIIALADRFATSILFVVVLPTFVTSCRLIDTSVLKISLRSRPADIKLLSVVIFPVADILPTTVNFSLGVRVFIPIRPSASNTISSPYTSIKCAISPGL